MLNHNVETVPRLYGSVRPQARFERSLDVLRRSHAAGLLTKSGLMLGLGEGAEEIQSTLVGLREAGVDMLTIGQYLRPSQAHLPVRPRRTGAPLGLPPRRERTAGAFFIPGHLSAIARVGRRESAPHREGRGLAFALVGDRLSNGEGRLGDVRRGVAAAEREPQGAAHAGRRQRHGSQDVRRLESAGGAGRA